MSYQIQNFNINDTSAYLTGVDVLSDNFKATEQPASCISVNNKISQFDNIIKYDYSTFKGTYDIILKDITKGYYLSVNNTMLEDSTYYITDYIEWPDDDTHVLYMNNINLGGGANVHYNINKGVTYGAQASTLNNSDLIDSETGLYAIYRRAGINSKYIRISFRPINDVESVSYSFHLGNDYKRIYNDNSIQIKHLDKTLQNYLSIFNRNDSINANLTLHNFISSNNHTVYMVNYAYTDYIPMIEDTPIYVYGGVLGGGFIVYYDENKNILFENQGGLIGEYISDYYYKIPYYPNAKLIRISVDMDNFERNFIYNYFDFNYNHIKDDIIKENNLEESIKKKLNDYHPLKIKQLNKTKYYTETGELVTNSDGYYSSCVYDVSNYKNIDYIFIGTGGALPGNLCCLVLLDESDNIIYTHKSTIAKTNLNVETAKTMLVSFRTSSIPAVFVNNTDNRRFEIFKNNIENDKKYPFGEFSYIHKHTKTLVNFNVLDNFTYLTIGRGEGMYFNETIKITKNSIENDDKKYELGFELKSGDNVTVDITSDILNEYTIKLKSGSNEYSYTGINFYADG